jgi:hypothetical protein
MVQVSKGIFVMKKTMPGIAFFILLALVIPALPAQQPDFDADSGRDSGTSAGPERNEDPVPRTPPAKALKLALGLELNNNTNQRVAMGRSLSLEYPFFSLIHTGVIVIASDDFGIFNSIEPAVYARWYFLKFGDQGSGLFVQGDIGLNFMMQEVYRMRVSFMGGIEGGARFYFNRGDLYAEPYVRTGYPFLWGAGARVGCRF